MRINEVLYSPILLHRVWVFNQINKTNQTNQTLHSVFPAIPQPVLIGFMPPGYLCPLGIFPRTI